MYWRSTKDHYLYMQRFKLLKAIRNQRMMMMTLTLIQHILRQDLLHGKILLKSFKLILQKR